MKQHRSISDRLEAVRLLKEVLPNTPVYADTMDNKVSKAFAGFPERFFIIQDGEVTHAGGMGPYYYDVNQVREWLIEISEKMNQNQEIEKNNSGNNNNESKNREDNISKENYWRNKTKVT